MTNTQYFKPLKRFYFMSVMILDTPQINYIRAAIERCSYSVTVDVWHYSVLIGHMKEMDIEKESLRLVRSWAALNDKSYAYKYREPYTDNTQEIKTAPPFKHITPHQLLKYVQCLIYNIEPEYFAMTEQEEKDYDLLKKLEHGISFAIISQMPEYKAAQWC